jgi:ribosomal protein S18 acetylase RimI-like enzyme
MASSDLGRYKGTLFRSSDARPDDTVLDDPVWASLTGAHAQFAEACGGAVRYRTDVCPFAAVSPEGDESVWNDLAMLTGPGATAAIVGRTPPSSTGWETTAIIEGIQMVDVSLEAEDHPDVDRLTHGDVTEMLELVRRTNPGPFLPATIELGTYLGIRRHGALVAMAGQRLHPDGWTEISAVCTDAQYRNRGIGGILVRATAADIRRRGDTPFLHAAATNTRAIQLYEHLGFVIRRTLTFTVVRAPE